MISVEYRLIKNDNIEGDIGKGRGGERPPLILSEVYLRYQADV